MIRLLCLLTISILLSACGSGTTFLTKEKPIVVMPDRVMFECPTNGPFPDPATLTDIQVAQIIIELKSDLEICRNKMKNLEEFLVKARERLER